MKGTIGCNHIFEISRIVKEPMGMGTAEREYAYVICPKCGLIDKRKVNDLTIYKIHPQEN